MRLLDHPRYHLRTGPTKDADTASERVLTKFRMKTLVKTPYKNYIFEGQIDPTNKSDDEFEDELDDDEELYNPRITKYALTSTFKVTISKELVTKADAAALFGNDELCYLVKNIKDMAPMAQHIADGQAKSAHIQDLLAGYKIWKTEKKLFSNDLQSMVHAIERQEKLETRRFLREYLNVPRPCCGWSPRTKRLLGVLYHSWEEILVQRSAKGSVC